MSKTKEEMAREYALDKVKGMHENNDCYHAIYFNSDKGYLAGYDSAISQASEGFEEWETGDPKGYDSLVRRVAWIASRLSAQKEKDALEEKLKLAIEALNYYSAKKDSGAHARDALEEIRAKHNLDKVER